MSTTINTEEDHNLDITDLTQNQLTELQLFSALAIVGGVKEMVRQGIITDPATLAYLDRYNTYANELRSRRADTTPATAA